MRVVRRRERQQHPGQRDPVGDAVVHAEQHRRTAAKTVDAVHLPHRMCGVDWVRDLRRDVLLQGPSIPLSGQRVEHDVPVEVEVLVDLPAGPPQWDTCCHGVLPELRETVEHALSHIGSHHVPVQWLVGPHERVDHHQVLRGVHAVPGMVHRGHCAHADSPPCARLLAQTDRRGARGDPPAARDTWSAPHGGLRLLDSNTFVTKVRWSRGGLSRCCRAARGRIPQHRNNAAPPAHNNATKGSVSILVASQRVARTDFPHGDDFATGCGSPVPLEFST